MTTNADSNGCEIEGPLVFQCLKCNSIVGDSYSLLGAREELQVLILSSSSNIARSAEVFTSYEGYDVGSTYFIFTCVRCDSKLGKYYITTSKDLDTVRERFTFHIDSISSYQLGKSQHGKLPEPTVVATEKNETTVNSSKGCEIKSTEEQFTQVFFSFYVW